MKLTATIENIYEDGQEVVTTVATDVDGPEPGEDIEDWAADVLLPLTGTGRYDGDASYFLEITECDDPAMVGAKFEWGL
ncbi:hypothetical protein GCM10028801_31330 [Nocardioides maradonensis]